MPPPGGVTAGPDRNAALSMSAVAMLAACRPIPLRHWSGHAPGAGRCLACDTRYEGRREQMRWRHACVTTRRRSSREPALMNDVVHELLDAVGVSLALHEGQQLLVLVGLAEYPLARTEQHRKQQQVVAVEQAGVGEATGQGGAAVDDDRAAVTLLELCHVIE